MDDIYKNIEKYNPNQKRKILFVFNYIIADMLRKNNLNPIVTELLTRSRELDFIAQSYVVVPKNIRLNSTHYFSTKIPNKR